jgi:predicted DNA-binding transcriptional regulator YafY
MERRSNRLLSLYILRILERYSDCDHKLTQGAIIGHLDREYDMACERKAIRSHIDELGLAGHEIALPDEGGYYLKKREFEDSELRFLIDGVLTAKHIPKIPAKQLLDKLVKLGSVSFVDRTKHVHVADLIHYDAYNDMFYNIDVLDEAISLGRKVSFFYNKYGIDKKLHHTEKEPRTVSPYQMVASRGNYYLVGNDTRFPDCTSYRLELITDIQLLDEPVRPIKEVVGERSLDIAKYVDEDIYMFNEQSETITVRINHTEIGALIDRFGSSFTVKEKGEAESVVYVKAGPNSFCSWAMQYGTAVTILAPEHLRNDMIKTLKKVSGRYGI